MNTANRLFTSCWLLSLSIVFGTAPVLAQSKGYALGDALADFSLRNVDGGTVTLANYRTQKGLIIVFTSNHCPFSKAYEDRLVAIDQRFAPQGYPVLAIMVNDPLIYTADSYENMKVRAREKGYPFAYVRDETQQVARAFGATRTPQVFIARQNNGQFILEYTGSIDDNPQDVGSVQRRYVDDAVTSLLADRPVQAPFSKPIGCAIKWK